MILLWISITAKFVWKFIFHIFIVLLAWYLLASGSQWHDVAKYIQKQTPNKGGRWCSSKHSFFFCVCARARVRLSWSMCFYWLIALLGSLFCTEHYLWPEEGEHQSHQSAKFSDKLNHKICQLCNFWWNFRSLFYTLVGKIK
jgi:hypothetical protein